MYGWSHYQDVYTFDIFTKKSVSYVFFRLKKCDSHYNIKVLLPTDIIIKH